VENKWVDQVIRRFQRQSAHEESRTRLLLPVLLPGTSPSAVPKSLQNLQYVSLDNQSLDEVADRVAVIVAVEPPKIA
jgi:hypothetical protein